MNYAFLIGRLGVDPELKHTDTGTPVCRLRVATNRSWVDKSGEKQQRTDWHTVVTWNKLAEVCNKYLEKGRKVSVVGSIQSRSYDDNDGVTRTVVEIIANEVEFLDGGGNGAGQGNAKPAPKQERKRPNPENDPFEDADFPQEPF